MFSQKGMHKLAEEQKLPGRNLSKSLHVTTQATETNGEASRPREWGMGKGRPCLWHNLMGQQTTHLQAYSTANVERDGISELLPEVGRNFTDSPALQ